MRPTITIVLLLVVSSHIVAAEPVRIVTLGDSITKGYREGVKPEETFSAYLEGALRKKGIDATVINVGIGGERTDQALLRLEKDVIAAKPKFVTIMYGTNDSYVDIGAKESRLTVEEYRANLQLLVTRLRDAKITPILMTEPRWGDKAGPNGIGEHPNVKLELFVAACRDVAKEMKTPLIDHYLIWSRKRARGADIGSWTTDQCHPNAEGHRVMAEMMLPTIERAIRE
ncbi:MAG: SGNH/GDSL hydrolase family protein [Planctomycetaceae bacterium]